MNTATPKQLKFINDLKAQVERTEEVERALSLSRQLWELGKFDHAAVQALLGILKEAPRKQAQQAPSAPEGMHQLEGKIYKVQRSPNSGRVYAKLLTGWGQKWHFDYAPGAVQRLSEDTIMTLEQAREFGALYGTCCVCGRTLTDENSISEGIGPVCKRSF